MVYTHDYTRVDIYEHESGGNYSEEVILDFENNIMYINDEATPIDLSNYIFVNAIRG